MTVEARVPGSLAPRESRSRAREYFGTEDWWAVWIGLAELVPDRAMDGQRLLMRDERVFVLAAVALGVGDVVERASLS